MSSLLSSNTAFCNKTHPVLKSLLICAPVQATIPKITAQLWFCIKIMKKGEFQHKSRRKLLVLTLYLFGNELQRTNQGKKLMKTKPKENELMSFYNIKFCKIVLQKKFPVASF